MQDRQLGDALAGEMMRSQIRTSIARRQSGNLFSEWLTWNLSRQSFKPTRPLNTDEEEPGIKGDDDAAPAKKPAAQKPVAQKAPSKKTAR